MVKRSPKRESLYLPLFGAHGGKDKSENKTGKTWPFLERGPRKREVKKFSRKR